MTDMTVSTTILQQLGGKRFLAMTGAKNLIGGDNRLTMQLPARLVTGRATGIWITLDPSDTYRLDLVKFSPKALEHKILDSVSGIYADNLKATFTRMTGIETHL